MDFNVILSDLEKEGNLRKLPDDIENDVIDFSSNDYLGIAGNKELVKEFLSIHNISRLSSSASRLLSSTQHSYKDLEAFLEGLYARPALLFNSGYHANTGILPVIASAGKTLILIDRFIHASIIDGVLLSRAEFKRFPHNDMLKLRKILEKNVGNYERIIIATESVFSMDGDEAPLEELIELKKDFPSVILYLDEAHSFGVKGERGLGMNISSSLPHEWDIVVCPLGKAAASMGAFVICNSQIKNLLINKSRPLIYSTALPPLQTEWTRFVIQKIIDMDYERQKLSDLGNRLQNILQKHFTGHGGVSSHIQPVIIGDSVTTVALSEELMKHRIKALPIRKPTVAEGTERLRLSLSAGMTLETLLFFDSVLTTINAKTISY